MFLLKSSLWSVRNYSTNDVKKRICVVGAGPAGFYAAQYILKHLPNSFVDIVEKLPVPFGLVRYGVAPDHAEVKNVISTFTKTAEHPNVRFIGNLSLGTDVSLNILRNNYHAVLLTYGADNDRLLGIPNETKSTVLSAREFVAWYNGLPGFENFNPTLENGDTAAIIGQGNVAIDVARILLSPLDHLCKTDITEYALEKLTRNKIKNIFLVGRRGPLQAAFTIKELREVLKMNECCTVWREHDFQNVATFLVNLQRPRKRITELMLKSLAEMKSDLNRKQFSPIFYRAPKAIVSNGIELCTTKLVDDRAILTDDVEVLQADLILRSIGYKSNSVDKEINFNHRAGLVNNHDGRILKEGSDQAYENGLYVSGWLGTGPTGVIISTMNNSFKVADNICKDFEAKKVQDLDKIKPGLDEVVKNLRTVSWDHWKRIDEAEVKAGAKLGKPREKIVSISEMLTVAGV